MSEIEALHGQLILAINERDLLRMTAKQFEERIADLQRQVEAERRARLISPWVVRQQARLTPEDIDQAEKEREERMQQALARARKLARGRLKLARSRLKRAKKAEEESRRVHKLLGADVLRVRDLEAELGLARETILDLRDALNRALKERDELRSQVADGS